MQLFRPLPDTHPELTVLKHNGYCEYRIENWCLAGDGSGRIIRRTHGLTWREGLLVLIVSYCWPLIRPHVVLCYSLVAILSIFIYMKCTQVVFESVIAIPPHGVQLETHRGLSSLPLTASRRFIPVFALQDFIINEGIHGWNVRYYLAALQVSSAGELSLLVAYENILPRFPVLLEVYTGIHEALFADFQ